MVGGESDQDGLRLLSIDGGGIRGLSSLIILRYIMHRLMSQQSLPQMPLPCEKFSIIAGTGTGGLIALMPGRLRMSVDEALEMYPKLSEVFSQPKPIARDGRFSATKMMDAFKAIVSNKLGDGNAKLVDNRKDACKVFVCCRNSRNMDGPVLLRTYISPEEPELNCTICEAARATSATPTLFKGTKIGSQTYIDGGMGLNNPAQRLLDEAKGIFPNRNVSCLISIGTGKRHIITLPGSLFFQRDSDINKAIQMIATDCEQTHEQVMRLFQDNPNVYFRFNVEQGIQNVLLADWEKFADVEANTTSYLGLEEVKMKLSQSVDVLAGTKTVPSLPPGMLLSQNDSPGPSFQAQFKPMPPAPIFMFGREHERSAVIKTLLSTEHPHVTIPGSGGMGKTTLALSILHAPEVVARYEHRYFVSCEAATSFDLLLSELADVLEIPPTSRDSKLYATVCRTLNRASTLLCLDNFETPWLEAQPRRSVDDLLKQLNSLPNLAILLTMRGAERPFNVTWSEPLLPILEPLQQDDTQHILEKIARETIGTGDGYFNKLLEVVGGVPLAATLLGHLLRDGLETSETLWHRWQEESTAAIETDGNDRMYSLDVSIQISMNCRYMKECPDAAQMLAVLALIPDGFPDLMTNDLRRHFPPNFRFLEALKTLRKVALVYVDQRMSSSRIRLLPPIRHFCQSKSILLPGPGPGLAIVAFYADFIIIHEDYWTASHYTIVRPELSNIQSLLISALNSNPSESVLRASIRYTGWLLYFGIPSNEVISLATERATSPGIRGDCLLQAGRLASYYNDFEKAENAFNRALELHREAQHVLGEANALHNLGEVQMHRAELEKAENSLNHALELHRQAHSVLGEANALQNLGEVQMRRSELKKAENSLNHALELHREAQDVLGEANALHNLGQVQMRRSELEKAENSLNHALELHRQAQDVLGEANALQNLGQVQMRRSDLEKAENSFNRALELHRQAHSVRGEANDLQYLGEVQMHHAELEKAENSFARALELFRQAQDVLGEATDLLHLGEVQMHRSKLEKAENSFNHALELYQQTSSCLGEANVFHYLGELRIKQLRFNDAEKYLNTALSLHKQVQEVDGQNLDLQLLEEVHRLQREGAES